MRPPSPYDRGWKSRPTDGTPRRAIQSTSDPAAAAEVDVRAASGSRSAAQATNGDGSVGSGGWRRE